VNRIGRRMIIVNAADRRARGDLELVIAALAVI
jgi:hypothetical protein